MSRDDSRDLIVLARRGGAKSICADRSAAPSLAALASSRRPASARAGSTAASRAGSTALRPNSSQSSALRQPTSPVRRPTAASTTSTGMSGPKLLAPVPVMKRTLRPGSAASASRPHRGKDGNEDPLQALKEKLEALVENHQSLDYCEKPFFRPALWEATWKNHEDAVRLLADKKASVCPADFQGRTPLHEAAYYGHGKLVEFLLERGHPINCQDTFGQTPLFRAVEAGRLSVVESLVARKAQVGLVDGDGVTVQHVAAFYGRPQLSEWLLYQGAFKNRLAMDGFDGPALPLSARAPPTREPPPPNASRRQPSPLEAPGRPRPPSARRSSLVGPP
mmetsp:Transcript_24813/g.51573  ORF Transcript_24813/g.51573 Transcript_24813/m.51573 type:complete len:335 (-) Transcript_24813:27-1031(-)